MNVSINKQGVLSGTPIEPYLTTSDGAIFRLILFHVVDKGTHLFTSSNAGYSNEWGLFSRLQYADALKYGDRWEFVAIQDGNMYRWTQTTAPSTSTSVTVNAVTGYTAPSYGLGKSSQANAYFGYGSWWGAAGSWTQFTSGGKTGIPGFSGVCTNYLALYARVDKQVAFFEEDAANANQFIEY